MKHISKLELISFITGFSLLTFELAAARVLAPHIGSSMYVWTSVIGTIIASLALGFWVGGKIADMRNRRTDLVWLLGLASLSVIVTTMFYPVLLPEIASLETDVRFQGVLAALLLFAPTSFIIGVTSPYLAKLNVRSLKSTGQHIASLDALNSIGGITGTFLTGFVLFGYIGSRQTFLLVALLLLAVSWLVVPRYRFAIRATFSMIVVVILGLTLFQSSNSSVVDIDTPSAHYQVTDYRYQGKTITGLTTGPGGIQSAVYTDGSDELPFWYGKEMASLTVDATPKRVLLLGGGAFTLPQYLAERLPDTQIDVVEIDPELEPISKQYFRYQSPGNVHLIFEDARTFINQSTNVYDLVLVDAYGDGDIPFSLMTKEYGNALARLVAPGGMLVANVIAGEKGVCRELLISIHAVYAPHFSYARYLPDPSKSADRRNNILVYTNASLSYGVSLPSSKLHAYSDNYTPAERLYYQCQAQD